MGLLSRADDRGRLLGWLDAGLVFALALAVRYVFVTELRIHSYAGNIRVSDAQSYFQLAKQIVAGSAPFEPYWQAPLYPVLLAGFQAIFGDGLYPAQWLHMAIGALNCALVFRLSEVLFGARAARVVAVIAVLYGPFLLFDVQPLPANLTMMLDLLLVLSYLRFRRSDELAWLAAAGLLLGAAIVTHGLAIFTLPVFLYDLATGRSSSGAPGRSARLCFCVFVVATLLAPAAVSVRNSFAAGTPVFVSYNAGINLYIGNHHDLEQTLGRRGGYEWGELFRDPYTSGAKKPAAMNRFFVGRAIEEWLEHPGAMFITVGKKALIALSGAEPKRNFPIYPLRENSRVLSALLWEVDVAGFVLFAFPAGLLIPLAGLGFWGVRRAEIEVCVGKERASLGGWVAILHMIGMLVFFPTARYRLPALILLLPFVGAVVVAVFDRLRQLHEQHQLRSGTSSGGSSGARLGTWAIVAGLLFVLVNPVASNVFRHPVKDRAEHLFFSALQAEQRLRLRHDKNLEARMLAQVNEAIRIDPDYPEPVQLLAVYYVVRDIDRSLAYFSRLNELVPNDQTVLEQIRAAEAMRDRKTMREEKAIRDQERKN